MGAQLLEYGPYLLAAYLAFALGILSPGPNVLAIVGTSMGTSRYAGMMMAFGISTGSVIWALMAVFGLTAILASFAWFGTVLRIVGGCYLLWLASNYLRAAKAGKKIEVQERKAKRSGAMLYVQGLGVQMTNPKAALYWLSVMSLVLRPEAPIWVAVTMVGGIAIVSFAGHLSWALLFSTRRVVTFYQRFKRVMDGALGAFFSALGLGLLVSVFRQGSKA